MFGRRNPDQPHDVPSQPALEDELDLDILQEIQSPPPPAPAEPELTEPALAEPVPAELLEPAPDPAWQAATPTILGPSVTRLLQEAEAARQRPGERSAAPPESAAAITQRLSPLETAPQPAPVVAPASRPAAQAAPANGEAPARSRAIAESVIGPDDFFDGRYRSERGVRIQGNARGSIESRQYIFVEGGAQVEADLSAEDITISGDFRGKITCRRRLEVTSTGKIDGQVQTMLLVVQEGGALDGELHMRGEQAADATTIG
jgi:cytoskeletal protein CcmA (bactofilin family)